MLIFPKLNNEILYPAGTHIQHNIFDGAKVLAFII